ncbi:MAG TPA: cytochrome c [Burkholderiaceae bacterium]|nr:cytochrome c [Burkholderiaceae bacterium]
MTSRRFPRFVLFLIGLFVLLALAVLLGVFRSSSVAPQASQPLAEAEQKLLVKKGRELVLAGDCLGCHSQEKGPQAAGGVPISTPFGTIYSTNISPDKEHGIGNYSREDFHRVLRDGIAPGKRNLYPAMPFVFTHMTTPDDIDAIYAYLMSLEPMLVANKTNTGVFRLPVRPFMNFWTLFNFPDRTAPLSDGQSELWTRGAYLTEGLAHCAACHTPFNFMMGTNFDRHFEGGVIDGVDVPNITPAVLAQRGFDVATLSQYLQTGVAPQGTSFAGMNTVTHFSTNAMDANDVEAIATYLLSDAKGEVLQPKSAPKPLPAAAALDTTEMQTGRKVYMAACAGCHGMQGEGVPNVSPALKGNAIIAMDRAHDTIDVILNGIPTERFTGYKRMYAMPPFAHQLNDQEVADLVTWVRAEWGGQATPVGASEVHKVSSSIPIEQLDQ